MSSDSQTIARPIKRFRIGFLSLLQIVLVVLSFFAINFLSSQNHRPYDMSDNLAFTLSPSTVRYLQSEVISGRDTPVEMIVAFRADSPFYEKIRPIAEEFARLSGGKVTLKLIDPIRANDVAESLAAKYGIIFNQDLAIIDARSTEERSATSEDAVSPHVNIVKIEDMVVYETDANNQRRVRGFLGEDSLRAGLLGAIEGKPRKMWVFSDKSDLASETKTGIWTVFSAALVSQNILPEKLALAGIERIPDDISAIAIISPSYDLTPEELAVIQDYWARPKAAIFIATGDKDVPPQLLAFLRAHGVTPRHDRVITISGDAIQTAVLARFTSGMEFTQDLWEKTTLFEGATRSLDIREGAEDLLNKHIQPFTLIQAAPNFWGETHFSAENAQFSELEDQIGPLGLAAAVIMGTATDDRFAGETSRMIVIGNSDFLSPNNARQTNLDFLTSTTNWLVGRSELTGEGPRILRLYKLPILPPQVSFINRVNLLFIPAFALLMAGLVWASRRS